MPATSNCVLGRTTRDWLPTRNRGSPSHLARLRREDPVKHRFVLSLFVALLVAAPAWSQYVFPVEPNHSTIFFVVDTAAAQPEPPALQGELYGIDRAHSVMTFTVNLAGLTKVQGTFNRYRGSILFDEKDITRSLVTVLIDCQEHQHGSRRA